MSLLFDQRYQWRNASHQGMRSVCRIRAFSSDGMGPVIIITEATESHAPPLSQVIECLVTLLDGLPEIQGLPGYSSFESAMWYLGAMAPNGPRFYRIRELCEDGSYGIDHADNIPSGVMDQILGMGLAGSLVTNRQA